MQKYKKLIIGSFLVLAIVLAPVFSFAKSEESKTNDNNGDKIEIKNELKNEIEKGSSNSIWNRILRFFNSPVNAMTQVNLNLAPSISGISAPTILEVGETGTWKVKASDPQNGTLDYSVDWGDVTSQAFAKSTTSAFVQTATFTHAYPNAGTYNITFTVTNNAGLKTTSKVSVLIKGEKVDTAPIISKVRVSIGSADGTVSWITDERATSQVFYSLNTPLDMNSSATKSVSKDSLNIKHALDLPDLTSNTIYYFVIKTVDTSGNVKISPEYRFMTTF